MGFLSDIVGGAGDFLFGEEPEVRPESRLDPRQQRLLATLTRFLDQPIEGVEEEGFEGERVAGLTSEQQQLLQALTRRAQQPVVGEESMDVLRQIVQSSTGEDQISLDRFRQGQAPDLGSILGQLTGQGPLSQFTGDPQDIDEVFRRSVADPLIEQFQEEVIPAVSREFAGQSFGSERRSALENVSEELAQELAGQRTRFAFDAREAARGRLLKSLGLGAQLAGQQGQLEGDAMSRLLRAELGAGELRQRGQQTALQGLGLEADLEGASIDRLLRGLQASDVERQVEQAERDAAFQEFLRTGPQARQQRVSNILAALGTPTRENIVFGGTEGALPGVLSGLAGGFGSMLAKGGTGAAASGIASSGALAGMSFLSSEDYKEDIRPANEVSLADALDQMELVSFRYKPDMGIPGDFVGTIAERTPEVFRGPDGKTVNLYNIISGLIASDRQLKKKLDALEGLGGE